MNGRGSAFGGVQNPAYRPPSAQFLARRQAGNHAPGVINARPSVFTDRLQILQRPEQDLRQGVSRYGVSENVKQTRPLRRLSVRASSGQPDEDL